jgi:beta-lactamase regulating signal transducer with metallopeptidase domain
MMALLLDHLWQSTLLALGLGLLALAFRKASAAVRHGLWLSASLKFLVPFAALALLGRLIGPAIPLPQQAQPEAVFIEQAAQPFSQPALSQSPLSTFPFAHRPEPQTPIQTAVAPTPVRPDPAVAAIHSSPRLDLGLILMAVWALGSAAVVLAWAVRWARLRQVLRGARRLDWAAPMPVLSAPSLIEPGLVGMWRPVLLVPEALPERLSRPEIDALLAHEACHLRRRDNLSAAAHMLVEALFWFHPLVWWIGARLIEERELACDEAVVRAGHDRAAYARSLVEICRYYLQSPLDCVAGASGSDLKTRVEAIMTAPPALSLSRSKKALLLAAGVCAIATPVAAGLLTTPAGQKAVARAAAVASRAAPALIAPAELQAAETPPDERPAAKPTVLARNNPILAPGLSIARSDAAAAPLAQDVPAPLIDQAQAPDAAASAGPPLTLVASTARSSAANSEVAAFAQSYGEAFWNTDRRICVKVEGLPSDKAAAVKARVEADARAVGVSVGRAQCSLHYDVEIRFATDADRAVRDVLNFYRNPVWPFPLDRPQGADRPIRAWYGMVYDFAGGTGGRGLGRNPSARQKLALAIVVVDPQRTQNLSLDLVSDYVAKLGLSQPRALDHCNVLPSITDLFAGACPGRASPTGLTAADTAFLRALYTGSPGIRATRSPSELADLMARLLGPTGASANSPAPAVQPAVAPTAPPRLSLTPVSLQSQRGDMSQKTSAFVRSFSVVSPGGPQGIPRWRGPVRIHVVGLSAEQNTAVEARVRAVAKAVGAPGTGLFPPNTWGTEVAIMFAADPQRLLDDIAAHRPYLLGDQRDVKTITRPVQAWHQVDDQTDAKKYGSIVVIVDLRRTRGANLGQLADYAAMMALSQPQATDRCHGLPSVTDLFAGPCPGRAAPQGLTPADDAYLTALYGGASIYGAVYPDEIAARMAKIMTTPTDANLRTTADIMIGNSNIRRSAKEMGAVDR